MLIPLYTAPHHPAYFAGREEGIVTVNAKPSRKPVLVLDAVTLQVLAAAWSLDNGHYLVRNIPKGRECLLMARDTQRGREPYAYDWIEPSTALTTQEQAELWQSWLS